MDNNTEALMNFLTMKNDDVPQYHIIGIDDNKCAQLLFVPFVMVMWATIALASCMMYIPVQLYNGVYTLVHGKGT